MNHLRFIFKIRSKLFSVNKFDAKYIDDTSVQEEKRQSEDSIQSNQKNSNTLDILSEENIFLSRNSDQSNTISHLTTPAFMNHSVVFISVIVSSFLILLFLVCLIIVSSRFNFPHFLFLYLHLINFMFE